MVIASSPLVPGTSRRGRGLIIGGLWLLFLVSPVTEALHKHPGPWGAVLTAAVTVAFAFSYLAVLGNASKEDKRLGWLAFAGMVAMAVVFCVVAGEGGMFTFVYLAAGGAMMLTPYVALLWTTGLIAVASAIPLAIPSWEFEPSIPFAVGMSALASFGFMQLLRRNWELVAAQEEIARLAVNEERLRFSRDLHDILGHSLTVITVKAELAGKLVSRAPEQAGAEIADVERLAREALADVRSTVAGYRGTSLAAEITQARRSLEAAGIDAVLPHAVDGVTGPQRELFGWIVREGVTNVVRHSHARTCTVRITPSSVEVVDDGSLAASVAEGSGLAGLRERVVAAGGTLVAGPASGGGFRLFAEVPA
ncbi:sensor histidine kinase [Tenggerimyces flavus]|uniref:Sensor histidine kinase n=1 Tax=Tenggerimyces flavus TaxID=1708749 RepID=A0ABV7YII7_9ACTN|nr:sensor histidine kinase [Tenggerimyces flavus]MBM7787383.1 two-component system sensor histidine kinase DesK [Tenggerimyces flavus]